MITIGGLAKHYNVLPSEVQAKATIFDLKVYDLMVSWENEKYNEAQGIKTIPKLSQEEMMSMIQKVKENPNGQ